MEEGRVGLQRGCCAIAAALAASAIQAGQAHEMGCRPLQPDQPRLLLADSLGRADSTHDAHLVEGDDEGRLAHLEQVDGLNGLRLQAVHEVDNQDGDVAQAAAARAQVAERLVPCRQRNRSCMRSSSAVPVESC